MANVLKQAQALGLAELAADPTVDVAALYYNTVSHKIRQYLNGAWYDVSAGSVALTGQSLNSGEIIVGNGSNVSAAVDTDVVGDIQADSSGGLNIKAGVIVNADINSSAAIALSKLAALTASKVTVTDGSGVISAASYAPGDVILKTGAVAFTADQPFGGFKATNVADPTSAQDAATKAYVDSVAAGLRPKQAVRVASTANIVLASALENGDVIDGVTLATNDRVLVKNQSTTSQNGIYIVQASGAAVRSTDFDSVTPIDEINGAYVGVQEGTANAGKVFVQYGTVTTVGTDAINFTIFSDLSSLTGGDMITVSAGDVSVDLASTSGLESSNPGNSAGQLRVKLEASNPSLQIDGSNQLGAKLNGSGAITSGASGLAVKLEASNPSIQISSNELGIKFNGSGALSKGVSGVAVNVDDSTIEIATNALQVKNVGITNAKLAANAVTDSKVDASAAIARSKLASGTANRVAVNDGSGVLSDAAAITASRTLISDANGIPTHSSVTTTELGYVSGVTSAIQTQLGNKASVALDNLSSVAINTSLISDTNNTDDLGSAGINWKDVHAKSLTSSTNAAIVANAGAGNINASGVFRLSGDGSNFCERQYVDSVTLTDNSSNQTITALTFAHASFEGFEMFYKIKEATSNRVRIGRFRVTTDGTNIPYTDEYQDSADVGVTFDAVVNGANINIRYTTTNSGNNKTMRCEVTRIRA